MLVQLIQTLYNIVDSLFIGKYSESGLTALSIISSLPMVTSLLGGVFYKQFLRRYGK